MEKKMRKIKLIVLLSVTLGLLTFGWNMPGIALAEPQTKCPVMNGKVDKKFFVDYKGKRIYFCCSGCVDEFKKDPEKYLKKMEAEGVTPANTP
jgi:YHS domain-containing protein